ncbi:MAG: sensor domain-containing diguanylate cyclase [Pseudomonadota bacterium]
MDTLRALNILDTPSDESFDRVTRLAQRLFNVDISLVSLVDTNRQWFKSKQGLSACETPRDISFCGHAILNDEVLVIEDAAADERFADNPLVTGEPNIRFYAGCPLKAANGKRMGTLCIIDSEPRKLATDEEETLKDLAGMVEANLASLDLATCDDLTGLANRRGFYLLTENALSACQRSQEWATLLLFDLNDFKLINDRLGHAHGDDALQDFGTCLLRTFRSYDVVARLGGDEFAVFLGGVDDLQVPDLTVRMDNCLRQRLRQCVRPYRLNYAVGSVSVLPDDGTTLDNLFDRADQNMYLDKCATKRTPLPDSGDSVMEPWATPQ